MAKLKLASFFIFHFRPLENYPPIQNLLKFLDSTEEMEQVYCFSTHGQLEKIRGFNKIKILRWGKVGSGKLRLWFSYLHYNLWAIALLLIKRPTTIMYFESLSAFPAFVYKQFINKNARIFIHYHEYTSKSEYRQSAFVERYFHAMERRLYPQVEWISHTNEVRLHKFLRDEQLLYDAQVHRLMPNYPSKDWAIQNKTWEAGQKLKLVYVGYSLTETGTYLGEVVAFLKAARLPVEINVYCMQPTAFVKKLEMKTADFTLKLHAPLPYEQLPKVLGRHHVGLILYKAKTPNYIHNAPNKLFEYLSCGLDVWYPKEMQGIHTYDSSIQPKVIRLDFNQLPQYDLKELIQKAETKNKLAYFAEDEYEKLLIEILK